jgi:hypothetical protein
MTNKTSTTTKSSTKQAWAKPRVRAVVPASHTRSGPFTNGPREDAFYRVS